MFKRQAGAILPKELDPQDNSLAATYSRDQLVQMADILISSPKATDARDLSMVLAMSYTAGRGDDVRQRRLCELTPPLLRACIGQCCVCVPCATLRWLVLTFALPLLFLMTVELSALAVLCQM